MKYLLITRVILVVNPIDDSALAAMGSLGLNRKIF